MGLIVAAVCIIGLLTDIIFIRAEYAGRMGKAVVFKGLASLFFVILGIIGYTANPTHFGRLILIGLVLGMVGDIFLNLRNLYEGGKSLKVFAVGILAFLGGHFLYIAALIGENSKIVLPALIAAAVISLLSIPPLMKRITAPNMGMKLFGYVYLVIVIAMFSCAGALLLMGGPTAVNILFAVGALLFMVSDFIMIYYSFGRKIKPLRAVNLLSYYVGQLLIAICILVK